MPVQPPSHEDLAATADHHHVDLDAVAVARRPVARPLISCGPAEELDAGEAAVGGFSAPSIPTGVGA